MGDDVTRDTEVMDLRRAVELVRERCSSIRLETRVEDDETALRVCFLGDEGSLKERQVLVSQLVRYLPPALSLLGVKQGQQSGESEAA